MIRVFEDCFVLDTNNTTYCFTLLPTRQLEHCYYGEKIYIDCKEDIQSLVEKHAFAPGNTIIYDQQHPQYSLEDVCLEMSSYGHGDIREPFIEIKHSNGNYTNDFIYDSYEIKEKEELKTLPSSYQKDVQELVITLKNQYGITLQLHYCVYDDYDVITRTSILINTSNEDIVLERLMSNQLDFSDNDYIFSQFVGSWANEMHKKDTPVQAGKIVNASYTGTSSSRANPFVMISKPGCNEDQGVCFGMNLIYSGNHYEALEVSPYGKTRFVQGINPQSFSYTIKSKEVFESPESVMTYSNKGYNELSKHMHEFVRNCIVRGIWQYKERPVLLNSWEACYFDINESKLLKLAREAKKVGIELFVMDDGWFASRNDDHSSLGDWYVNKKKLPHGLEGLVKKINDIGLDFGIWVEPEMVNVDSELYRTHPDWTLGIENELHSEGRNQRILDLTNPDVRNYIIDTMTDVFSSANISYVKWDMNRIVSTCYSSYLQPHQQGEVFHRYVLGFYEVVKTLTERFPNILFEGCASGGNRFDLGMLCYFPQIWASDDSDALYRVNSQTNYSYGYPTNTIGAHVSATPNHQTLRKTPLYTRFNVACFGVLGYEYNLCDLKQQDLQEIKAQIELYKQYRHVLQFGQFYRGRNNNIHEWTCVSKDQEIAIGMMMQELVEPNHGFHQYYPKGLKEDWKYHFTNQPLKFSILEFGDLINTVAPIHVKQDSLIQKTISHFVSMDSEVEDCIGYGKTFMQGIKLKQAFGATGYNDQIRYFPDFASRLYFLKHENC